MSWIRFNNSKAFWLFLGIIPLILLFAWANRQKQQQGQYFSQHFSHLTRHIFPNSRNLLQLLIVLAFTSLVLAYLQPQIGQDPELVEQPGIEIMIAIDLSMSMLAQDIKPSRLEFAKTKIIQLLDLLENDGVGLIAFAGSSYIQSPLTTDYSSIKTFLFSIDATTISRNGTEISRAIQLAIDHFSERMVDSRLAIEQREKILVFVSDGEDHSQVAIETAKIAKEYEVRIYCLGIGQPGIGSPIPVHDKVGRLYGYKKDQKGKVIVSKLNENLLKGIAETTGGSYYRLSHSTNEINDLYQALSNFKQSIVQKQRYTRYEEKFQWPIAFTLLCLIVEWFLPAHLSDRRWWDFIRFRLLTVRNWLGRLS